MSSVAISDRPSTSRLLILIVEVEQPEGLSSRKLIIESMKHNVVTAYSGEEALELLSRCSFDIALVHSAVRDIPCEKLIARLRAMQPSIMVGVITPSDHDCGEDKYLDSLRPDELVQFCNEVSRGKIGKLPIENANTFVQPKSGD